MLRFSTKLAHFSKLSKSIQGARFFNNDVFSERHIGPSALEKQKMLEFLGFKDLDTLTNTNVPDNIKIKKPMEIPSGLSEHEMLKELRAIAGQNKQYRSYIGMGFHDCIVPATILRNMLQNAGWTTSYTPYQPELAQGRLESLLNFQTVITDLTGLEMSNASLLDEATACAEAIALAHRATKKNVILYDPNIHPQNLDLLITRSGPMGITLKPLDYENYSVDKDVAGVVFQYPDTTGNIHKLDSFIEVNKEVGALSIMVCDLMSLTLLRSPGDLKADIAVGSAQRFGTPLGFGGPHAGFISCVKNIGKIPLSRMLPGRIVGVSKDVHGNKALRLALQTREQHIRRDKATSNICTAQALPANLSAMYAVYHGPHRLTAIARKIHKSAAFLSQCLKGAGYEIVSKNYFDTIQIRGANLEQVQARCEEKQINLRFFDNGCVGVALNETVSAQDVSDILYIFDVKAPEGDINNAIFESAAPLIGNSEHGRTSLFLTNPVFNTHHSEASLTRYMKKLENKDLSLVHSMIPLGSCTMKLNAAAAIIPFTWPSLANIHPFVPSSQSKGYAEIFKNLEDWLCQITGYDNFSLQPNSGANGEYAGMLAIKGYLKSIGQEQRNICLIPSSAHGTNPASAQMCNFRIVPVDSDKHGNINFKDLCVKAEKYKNELGAIMVTYPSTHGVFESTIMDVCAKVHEYGGQVYLDGANLNAQIGLCRPGDYGSDVSHLNLHKSCAILHGGGGPGAGPIGVKSHLAPFLPGHPIVSLNGLSSGSVSASPWGSASILSITWAYIRMMGGSGLKEGTQIAILNANYMAKRLEEGYRIVYKDEQGLNAHEFIIDCKPFKKSAGIEVIDIAKRLMDYGFHSPTMAWPVQDCLMIEPTESENKEEMDRFVDSLISIREEIRQIEDKEMHPTNNPLKNSPHTMASVTSTEWNRPYTRELAAFPKPWCHHKSWPTVGRIDDQYGDKNLICSCPPMDSYN
uniref:Glycine cleavage system P protein n=1 Tax=Rhabditophanes sp. KR3021 TaxID=114890 RepID=A0AC35TUB5_9BILA